jgi:hypothetical protein
MAMKTIAFTLIALSLVVGLVNPASAFDPRAFWEQQQSNGGGG